MSAALTQFWTTCRHWLMPLWDPRTYVQNMTRHLRPFTEKHLLAISERDYRRYQWAQHQRANAGLLGEQRTLFRGQGLDFAELREYMPGDDIRKLDWQVFARTQIPHIREYREERQMTVWLVLDWSPALGLGPAQHRVQVENGLPLSQKAFRAIELLLLLSHLAYERKAKVGFYWQGNDLQGTLKPQTGHSQHLRIMQTLLEQIAPLTQQVLASHKATAETLLEPLQRVVLKQDWVLVVTDNTRITQEWAVPLGSLAQRANVHIFGIEDFDEQKACSVLSQASLISPDTSKSSDYQTCIQPLAAHPEVYQQQLQERQAAVRNICPVISVNVSHSLDDILQHWLGAIHAHQGIGRRAI